MIWICLITILKVGVFWELVDGKTVITTHLYTLYTHHHTILDNKVKGHLSKHRTVHICKGLIQQSIAAVSRSNIISN